MEVTTEILSTFGASVVVIIVNYWMVIPTLVLCFTSYVYYKIFQHTIKKIRRVEGTSKCGYRFIKHTDYSSRTKSNFHTFSCFDARTERDQSVQSPRDIAKRVRRSPKSPHFILLPVSSFVFCLCFLD
jgi:hypothetical protein